MTAVITAQEARKITRGREPLVPVEYETAVKALAACVTLDEAKYWDNKADALAAWAKIYHDKKVEREAQALKLWAFRRMGELAAEIQPKRGGNTRGPGPQALLVNSGLSKAEASASRRLARVPREDVEALANMPRPPSPVTAQSALTGKIDSYGGCTHNAFSHVEGWGTLWQKIGITTLMTSKFKPATLALSVAPHAVDKVRERVVQLIEWLDEFERHLPKGEKK